MPRIRKTPVDRRADIIAAVAALLRERGLDVATRDVSERLGISSGLLNHYFKWSELRALALAEVFERDFEAVLHDGISATPAQALSRFVTRAFAEEADAIWRLWIDAVDAAVADSAIAAVLRSVMDKQVTAVTDLVRAGAVAGAWRCSDPTSSAIRLIALHDGLVGFLLTGTTALSRRSAAEHLHVAISLECPGYTPPHRRRSASAPRKC